MMEKKIGEKRKEEKCRKEKKGEKKGEELVRLAEVKEDEDRNQAQTQQR